MYSLLKTTNLIGHEIADGMCKAELKDSDLIVTPHAKLYHSGTTVTFRCGNSNLVLSGPNHSMCINSVWSNTWPSCSEFRSSLRIIETLK